MFVHTTQIRVRYGEVDRMGFLYHSHYVEYFDVARSEMMRSVGLTNFMIEQSGYELPVMHVEINYKKAALYDDLITIRTTMRELPRITVTFDYEVFRQGSGEEQTMEPELITTGTVRLAYIRRDTKKAVRTPEHLLAPVRRFFE
ncbi:MAG: thioesterase family protein [Mucinivorans sp.]